MAQIKLAAGERPPRCVQVISNNVKDGSAQQPTQTGSAPASHDDAKSSGPTGMAKGAAVGGLPGAAVGSMVDSKTADKDAEQIQKQLEKSTHQPSHGSATKGMTDMTAQ
ncbi:hypothetical protein WJX84_007694 [Apatococcus fuscideae]|uniref:Uncharacterized protein n=1 Tax=Apatococcus fuscideae TaxID=2026836 RepID=A0AAW1RL11_9CHLO